MIQPPTQRTKFVYAAGEEAGNLWPTSLQFLQQMWLAVSGLVNPSDDVDPVNNGDLVIEATSNTTLTFKFKGSDGTVRSGTIALS